MGMVTVPELREYLDQVGKYALQLVSLTGSPTGGTFTLKYEGQNVAAIAYNALASTVQSALEAVSTIGTGKVVVTGPAGGPWYVLLNKDRANGPISLVSHTLTGGSSPNVDIDLANDELLQKIIDRATSIIEQILGFAFDGYTDETEKTVRSYGGEYLRLPPHELGSITEIVYYNDTTAITGWEETERGNLAAPSGFVAFGYEPSTWGVSRYTITANWGYGDPPEVLKEVCLELAVNIWRGKDRGLWTEVIGSETSGGYIKYTGGLTTQQRAIIEAVRARYKEVPV